MKKKRSGFTLIELLAVIVILGLLMAIAIPSVTKYITQSRKKTLVSTIGNYISAAVNEVNDLTYTFTESNTIYALPIECISLERGGNDPFGAWHQANDSYWAYVLVQYDDETSSYTYGYTFKDSAGYGLYPTSQSKLNESGKQIQTGLDLNQPKLGKAIKTAKVENWNGFKVDSETNLVVLVAESDGNVGDGKTTCTLQQKGDNYANVEEDKKVAGDTVYFGKPYETTIDGKKYSYIFYKDGSASYYENCELVHFNDSHTFEYLDGEIWYWSWFEVAFEVSDDKKTIVEVLASDREYSLNRNTSCDIFDVPTLKYNALSVFNDYKTKIKTVTFQNSINVPSSVLSEHKKDVSMSGDGKVIAYIVPNSSDSSYYDLYIQANGNIYANIQSSHLFAGFTVLDKINNIELLNTSNVIDMQYMFYKTGAYSSKFTLDLGNNFDTSKVENMTRMFLDAGRDNPNFTLDLGDKFDTSNVKDMSYMFDGTGYNSNVFTLDLGDKFDTSNVKDMYVMFSTTGRNSEVFTLDLGDKFDTKNVTNMSSMFYQTGYKSKVFTLDLGDKFDTSNVKTMGNMFFWTGYSNTNFTLDIGDKFNTSKVTSMYSMFSGTGYNSPGFYLDCSSWNVDAVTSKENFNKDNDTKVIAPQWKN